MINFIFLPSLEHTVLAKVAISFCTQNDILKLIPEYDPMRQSNKWYDTVKIKILKKIRSLPLPKLFHLKLVGVVRQICFEILSWKVKHREHGFYYSLLKERMHLLQWTSFGKIDDVKTAKELVKCDLIPAEKRYYVACFYCLQDDVRRLRGQFINDPYREDNLRKGDVFFSLITSFWSDEVVMDDVYMLEDDSTHKPLELFHYAAYADNIAGVKYFLQKLNANEKKNVLVSIAKVIAQKYVLSCFYIETYRSDLLFFLMSVMSPEQQMEVFESRSLHILIYFLSWPMRDFFFEVLDKLFNFLCINDLYKLLKLSAHTYSNFKEDMKLFNYHAVFEVIWKRSSEAFKTYIVKDFCISGTMLLHLLVKARDTKCLLLILECANDSEKENINEHIVRASYPNCYCFCDTLNLPKACEHRYLRDQPLAVLVRATERYLRKRNLRS